MMDDKLIAHLLWADDSRLRAFFRGRYGRVRPVLSGRESSAYHRRLVRERDKGPGFSRDEFLDMCQRFDGRCLCCGTQGELMADHIVPMARGGSHSLDNIQPLCNRCNFRKGLRVVDYRGAHI